MKLVNIHTLGVILLLLVVGIQSSMAQVLTLNQCIDTARVHNKNLQTSKNIIAMGEQKQKEARGNLLPKVTANADYRYYTNLPYQQMPLSVFGGADGQFKEAQFGVPHNINANLQLAMPLYNPQLHGAIQTTKIASELSGLQYLKTEEQIYFEISNLYYNAQILHHQLAFIDSNLANTRKLLQNTELLKEHLLAKGTDVSKVKLQLSQTSTQKAVLSSKYNQILNALKFAMGIPIERNLEIEPNIEYQDIDDYAYSSVSEIVIVKTQYRLLASELNTIKQSKLPSLSLFGTYGSAGFGYDKKPNNFLKFYPIGFAGIQLTYPLFNGTTKRKVSQKQLELQNSELQLGLITEQTSMQIENSKLQKRVAKQSIETTLQQIQLAQAIYEQTILQQKLGTANLTEVLLTDTALREAQQAYLSAVIDYLKADLELKKATGNISTSK